MQTRTATSGSEVRIPLTAVDDSEHEADQHLGIGVRITGIAFRPAGGGDEVDLYAGAPEAVKQAQALGFAENDAPSGNAALASLAVSAGALSPPFSAERLAYRVEVEHGVETLRVTAAAAHPAARVTVAGVAVESGAESGPIALAVGETAIAVGVTAQDGTLRSYTLTVERAAGNRVPVFKEGSEATRSLEENAAAGEAVGLPVGASDEDGDPLTYLLEGADAAAFGIDAASGQLLTAAGVSYDFEVRASYAVRVRVEDGRGGEAAIAVTVAVTDLEEPPAAPGAPAFGASTPTELEVSWPEPANSGPPISGYEVGYREGESGVYLDGNHQGSGRSLRLTGLKPDTPLPGAGAGLERGGDGWLVAAGDGQDGRGAGAGRGARRGVGGEGGGAGGDLDGGGRGGRLQGAVADGGAGLRREPPGGGERGGDAQLHHPGIDGGADLHGAGDCDAAPGP